MIWNLRDYLAILLSNTIYIIKKSDIYTYIMRIFTIPKVLCVLALASVAHAIKH